MLRKILSSAILLACAFPSFSQDSATSVSSFKVSGYVDVYYRFNFSQPKRELETFNNFTSFTNSQQSFELNTASVKLEHAIGKVGMVVDLGFGKRAEEFSYNDENTFLAIKQAFLTYAPASGLKLTAGSFATHVGYELVDPNLNRNYSMSYQFSYGPFFHTGLKADLTLGKSGIMLGVANPTDLKSASFSKKFLIGQYSFAPTDKMKIFINYQGGNADDATKMRQFDAVITNTITEKVSIGYNGTAQYRKLKGITGKYGDASCWWSSALYLNADPSPLFGITLRAEYMDDEKNVLGYFSGSNIFATTLSANVKAGKLTFIPELRHDNASKSIFLKSNGSAIKKTTAALLAAVYSF